MAQTGVACTKLLGVAESISVTALGKKLLLNQSLNGLLKLGRVGTRSDESTANPINREESTVIAEPRIPVGPVAQRDDRQCGAFPNRRAALASGW